VTFERDVDATTERLASRGLAEDEVAAIGAGLHDVFGGLRRIRDLLDDAIASGDRRLVQEARSEVDDHLKPHLRDLSKALRKLDRHLKKAKRIQP
jgi:hypothetical protein